MGRFKLILEDGGWVTLSDFSERKIVSKGWCLGFDTILPLVESLSLTDRKATSVSRHVH
jgi:hypothetical protein